MSTQTSGLKSFESSSTTAKPAVDDDDDELEALRTAALMSMKAREKHKPNSLNSEPRERPGAYSSYSRYHHSNQRAMPGKPLFSWSQHTRPNLIVIQPVPLEGSEAAPPSNRASIQTAQPSSKLLLPQDRWCPQQGQDSPASASSGPSKRRGSGKFSHFESSSESEESDDDLLPSGSVSSPSDPSHGHSSDDEQNSACLSPLRDSLDGCLSESTSDLLVSAKWHEMSPETGTTDCARKSGDVYSALHTSGHGSSDGIDSGIAHAPSQASGEDSESGEDVDDCTAKDLLGLVSRQEPSVEDGLKNSAVTSENVQELPVGSPGLCGSRSGNDSPVGHMARKSPSRKEYPQKHEARLTNGVSLDVQKVHVAPDNQREDWFAPLSREKNSSREGTPKSTRSVDSQDRAVSSVFEARRRKFESTVPVKPVGGKIVLLKGQSKTDELSPCHESSPLPSPRAQARSRSRSTSPPFLRSVLSVVKRGPGELLPACAEPRMKHRSGRTAEVIVHSVGEESSDASDRIACSSKLPVHLRLGDPSMTRKKKSKRKRSSHDSSGYSAKRKHAKGRCPDSDVRRTWLGPEQRRRRKCMPSAHCDGAP